MAEGDAERRAVVLTVGERDTRGVGEEVGDAEALPDALGEAVTRGDGDAEREGAAERLCVALPDTEAVRAWQRVELAVETGVLRSFESRSARL